MTIKAKRKQLGMSQEELAYAVGISTNALQKIENGKSMPTLTHWFRIYRVLYHGEASNTSRFVWDGNALYEMRKKSSVTQKQLEKKLSLPQNSLSAWERGATPSLANIDKLCRYFSCSLEAFFTEVPSCDIMDAVV